MRKRTILKKADFPNKDSYTKAEVSQIINYVMEWGRAPDFVDQLDPYEDPNYLRRRGEEYLAKADELEGK